MVLRSLRPDAGVPIEGHCDPRFAAVQDAFTQNFASRGEAGASVSVTLDGEPVVDLWGGFADAAQVRPWQRDTLCCVQSVSKGISALALHMAVERGLIDVDAPVSRYWPEFAQQGKEGALVRWCLDHRIGLPIVAGAVPGMAYDWARMAAGLAATTPMWAPGSTPCYHSANYGFIVGELLRRVTGRSVGRFVRDEIAGPLGIEAAIGLQPDEDARVATTLDAELHPSQAWIAEGTSIFARSWKIFHDDEDFNSADWRHAEIPSTNCHTNARSLARLGGLMACGGALGTTRLLEADTLRRAAELQWSGRDVQNRLLSMSLGFLLPTAAYPSTGVHTIGMLGAGGATAFADPERRLGFGYVMNALDPTPTGSKRSRAIIEALNRCLS